MKKLILTGILAVAGLTATANAQIQKGNWMVGSSIVASNFGLNTGGGYNISLQPKAAYFIQDNVAVGGYVDLGFARGFQLENNQDILIGEKRNTVKSLRYFSLEEINHEALIDVIKEAKLLYR